MAPVVPTKRRRSFLTAPSSSHTSASRTFKANASKSSNSNKNTSNKPTAKGNKISVNSNGKNRKALRDKTNLGTNNGSKKNVRKSLEVVKKTSQQESQLSNTSCVDRNEDDNVTSSCSQSSSTASTVATTLTSGRTASTSVHAKPTTNVRVAVRIRPANSSELSHRPLVEPIDKQMLLFDPKDEHQLFNTTTNEPRMHYRDLNKRERRNQTFVYDAVFGPDANNIDVFERTTKDLVEVLFNGYNASVFVYGQTGSGKTHTMLGSNEDNGLTFLTAKHLFDRMATAQSTVQCDLAVSYLEVYNENLFDLINPGQQLAVRDDANSAVSVQGLSMHPPKDPEDLLRLLRFGNSNRTQHPTDANAESSRSHAVFQVYLKQRSRSVDSSLKVSKLSMIDLAGSERGSVTHQRGGARINEGKNINKSLLALGNCINALAEGSKFINYRDSKLTRILKDSIGGNCQTVMIATVSPSSASYENTFNTLKFAERAKKIKSRLKQNVVNLNLNVAHFSKLVEGLKRELTETKQELLAKEEEIQELKKTRCTEEMKIEMADMRNDLVNKIKENKELKEQLEAITNDRNGQPSLSNESAEVMNRISKTTHKRENYDTYPEEMGEGDEKDSMSISPSKRPKVSQELLTDNGMKCNLEEGHACQGISAPHNNISDDIKDLRWRKEKLYKEYHAKDVILKECRAKRQYTQRIIDRTRVLESHDNARLYRKLEHLKGQEKRRKSQVLSIRSQLDIIDNELRSLLRESKEDLANMDDDHLRVLDLQLGERTLLHIFSLAWKEQSRTEEVVTEALKQLRSKQMLLDSYGTYTNERDNYDALVKAVRCGNVQFPTVRMESTNEDSRSDTLGNFFGPILEDAELDTTTEDCKSNTANTALDETFVVSSKSKKDEDNQKKEADDGDRSPQEKWKPPTPPKKKAST